ncbi:hypothetical protein [Brachybacterium hainanense]|uniref:DUF4352 domain-containing protein n=1 Tax=Brachybacterium hainanense TaxID=1541174 RepID=A0ABV6R5V9_9MICO
MTNSPMGPTSSSAPNRTWIWIVSGCCVLLLLALLVLGVAGFVVYRANQPGGDPTATATQETDPGGGTAVGEAVEVPTENGTATVSFGAVDWDANAEVAEANSSNAAPPEGHVYIVVPVTMTYAGTGEFTGWLDVTVTFVGADGAEYSSDGAVVEKDLFLEPAVTDGGTTEGNLVFLIPAEAAEGGEFHVSTWEMDEPQSVPAV